MADAKIKVEIEGKVAQFVVDMDKAEKSVKKFGHAVEVIKWDSIVRLGEAAYRTANQFYSFARTLSSSLNEIDRQSKILGLMTNELQEWQFAAKMADVDNESLAIGFKFLAKNMEDASKGTGDAAKYLSMMGVSITDASGGLRPLNDVMKDVMDKFAGWTDGPRKIAIALELFGRSGQNLVPLLNLGRAGFDEFAKAAKELGIVIDPELIAAGTRAEDNFKKFEERVKSLKAQIAPLTETFIEFLSRILPSAQTLKTVFDEIGKSVRGISRFMQDIGLMGGYTPEEWERGEPSEGRYARKYLEIRKKAPPPQLAKKIELSDIDKLLIKTQTLSDEEDTMASVLAAQVGWLKLQEDEIERIKRITGLVLQHTEMIGEEDQKGAVAYARLREEQEHSLEIMREMLPIEMQLRRELEKPIEEDTFASVIAGGELLAQRTREATELMEKMWLGFADNITSAFQAGFFDLFKDGLKNAGDAFRQFADNMLQSFLRAISQMITNALIFGNIMGTSGIAKGAGFGGLMGMIFPGWTKPLQAGGIVKNPTLAMLGEKGPEAVIPLSQMGSGNGTTVVLIQAMDSQSMEDYVRRNPGPFLKLIHNNAREAGSVRSSMRAYGQ